MAAAENTHSEPFVNLRVLTEFDKTYRTHVAYCLETGSVVTSDDPAMLDDMIQELLSDEVTYALEHDKNFTNLLSTPAKMEVWAKWAKAASLGNIEPITITVKSEQLKVLLGRAEVTTEVRIARAA